MNIAETLQEEFSVKKEYIENILSLLSEGSTIPFIARYRKEMHGSTDDQVLRKIAERAEYLENLTQRKVDVIRLIDEQGKLTIELEQALNQSKSLTEIDDLYRPFRAKRKTRASVAHERGLAPLAEIILQQQNNKAKLLELAQQYVQIDLGVATKEDALQGSMDIIAEDISNDATLRQTLRTLFTHYSKLTACAVDTEEKSVYETYYDFSESIKTIAGYRILAINRGERENILSVHLDIEEERVLPVILKTIQQPNSVCEDLLQEIALDAYKRLIFPSLSREIHNTLTEQANQSAIQIFSENLRNLLMVPPIKGHVTLGLDPGFRTGCKIAVIDETGRVLDTSVIYNTAPNNKVTEAKKIILTLIKKHTVTLIAIGNGTASRESEQFIADLIAENQLDIAYVIVNEAGASVYSASPLAAQEFPEFDVSLRSAVSIARRLQDALAELVKIDPKSVGVGQYQHDMPKAELNNALSNVVEDCVNSVGVELNTASPSLLRFVSGISETVAKNIVSYRETNGAFSSRKELLKVPKLGKRTFEQCAGFLRVSNGDTILDYTGVHPESYAAAQQLLTECNFSIEDVRNQNVSDLPNIIAKTGPSILANSIGIGVPTLIDIGNELIKPGRDPRDELPQPLLRKDVLSMEDLHSGMTLTGTVRNVIDFGAFVDIGVHEDGLVHISQLADRFVKHPSEIVQLGDIVTVKVLDVDIERKRISLTMRDI